MIPNNNLIESIQQNLGYPSLKKVDSATQNVALDPTVSPDTRLSQAAIPAALAALFKFLKTDEGVYTILDSNNIKDWTLIIFGNAKVEVLRRVACYANYKQQVTEKKLNEIIEEAIRLIKASVEADTVFSSIKKLLSTFDAGKLSQYLPSVLNLNKILNEVDRV